MLTFFSANIVEFVEESLGNFLKTLDNVEIVEGVHFFKSFKTFLDQIPYCLKVLKVAEAGRERVVDGNSD